jgi:hypothetical protein
MVTAFTRGAIAFTIATAASPLAIEGQSPETIQVSAEPTCRTCTIELTRVATLGSPTDSVLLQELTGVVATNSRREYFVPAGFQIAVYDSQGRLTRAVGRRGRGPGEFFGITHIAVLGGDSVLVGDQRNGGQLFTPDLQYVRPIAVTNPGGLAQAVIREDGSMIMEARQQEIRIVAPTGATTATIPVRTTGDSTCRLCDHRWLAKSAQKGIFWSTINNRYEIEMIDTAGRVHRTLSRRPTWFAPWTSMPPRSGADRGPPLPALGQIREAPDGLLWVSATVADANWKYSAGGRATDAHFNAQYDHMLAVIDPTTGQVLAERRLPDGFGFVGRDLIFTTTQDANGYVAAHIWRLELKRR